MITAQAEELLDRLKTGSFQEADVQLLEGIPAHDFVAELDSDYRYRFQERRIRNKWEVGMARSLALELVARRPKGALFFGMLMVPVFRNCLFLTSESGVVSGISVATRLTVRQMRRPLQGFALALGPGFKLDHLPDGWHVKPLGKRTVKLTDEFLQERGWRFDALQQLFDKS
jgi:hypothetical protein